MKSKVKFLLVAGTRPNFIKIAPLIDEFKKYKNIEPILVHTGQHYDFKMSRIFFQELRIPKPNYNLGIGSGSHAYQTAKTIEKLEPILIKEKPNLLIVVGDVNSTLAGSLSAVKLHIPVAHVEAGLRNFDLKMPEEINRLLTDHVSDFLFSTEPTAIKNLIREGISKKKIFYVGNIMIDSLIKYKKEIKNKKFIKKLNLKEKEYCVLTLHRSETVDDKKILKEVIETIKDVQESIKIVWPVHPRTKKMIKYFFPDFQIKTIKNLIILPPVGYLEMLSLMALSKFVMTDSGGMQEETTFLEVPCLTLRKTTERPITEDIGTNTIVGLKKERIIFEVRKILNGYSKKGKIPKYWDGKTAKKIASILNKKLIK